MKTLNVQITEKEFNKYRITKEKISFADLIKTISKELMRDNLNKCIELADKYGLSKMTMDEITNEVIEVRKNAKNSN
jgi:hypothetical protein